MMKSILLVFFCLMIISSSAQSINHYNNYLQNSNQVVFVKANSDSTINGKMFLYERKNHRKQWKLKDSFDIVVGKNGLGKDATSSINLNNITPVKHEGDGNHQQGF